MELSIRWLYILIGLAYQLFGFLLLIIRSSSRQVPGPSFWALGCFAGGTGLLYFALFPWPNEYLNILFSNFLILLSYSLFHIGILKFKNKKVKTGLVIILPLLTIILNTLFILVWDLPHLRIAINSGLIATSGFILSFELLLPFSKIYRKIFLINSLTYLAFGLVMISRAVLAGTPFIHKLMESNPANIMILAFSAVLQAVLTYGYIIMVNIWVAEDLKMQVALRDKFLSVIAHDLKNQINIIGGFSDLLHNSVQKYESEKSVQFSGYIRQAAIQTNALLSNLLEWARVKSKTEMFQPERINLSRVIQEEVEANSFIAFNKGIDIQFKNAHPDLEVLADKNMLKTILRNLIINAVKFTNKGGNIGIEVSIVGKFAEVSVSDSGIGIKPAALKNLFDNTTLHTTEGTGQEAGNGLGLLLCREFVERHGGKISALSTFEQGSTFKFTIPC